MSLDQKPSGKRLDDLPSLNDEFWKHADVRIHEIRPKVCEHYFIQVNGQEVECKHCHAGFITVPGMNIDKGRIYHHGERIL